MFIPVIGIFAYLIARGHSMRERTEEARARQVRQAEMMNAHMTAQQQPQSQSQSHQGTPADQLSRLADLRQRGVLSAEEFDREKAKVLSES